VVTSIKAVGEISSHPMAFWVLLTFCIRIPSNLSIGHTRAIGDISAVAWKETSSGKDEKDIQIRYVSSARGYVGPRSETARACSVYFQDEEDNIVEWAYTEKKSWDA
jgi:hypothetical protein